MLPIINCSGVYLLVLKNGDKYVGASYNVKKRISHHANIKGIFEAFLLEKVSRCRLPLREKFWIRKIVPNLNKRPNQTGGAGLRRSDETKNKMSKSQKGIKRRPNNSGHKISAALKGVPKTKNHKLAAAKARKKIGNKPWTNKQRENNIWTTERRIKLSISKKGKPWSKARRLAQRKNRRRKFA